MNFNLVIFYNKPHSKSRGKVKKKHLFTHFRGRGQGGSRARAPPARCEASSTRPHAMHDPNKGIRARRPRTSRMSPSVIQNGLPSPRIDLHTSRSTNHPGNGLAVCSPSSCKNRRRECSPAPKKGRETPEGAVFCALRNLALPPECLNRSVKCAAFNADLSTRHRHPAGLGEVWRGTKCPLQVPGGERGARPTGSGRFWQRRFHRGRIRR